MASNGELDGEGSGRESSRSGEESGSEEEEYLKKGKMSEYEQQRFSRIAENKSRLEALLGPSLNSIKIIGKPNSDEEDEDYRPGEADDDEEDECLGNSIYERKNKRKVVLSSKNKSDPFGEEDEDLNKAIALSLQGSVTAPSKRRKNDEEAVSWKKKKLELMSKMQMTEDELVIFFYQFDEAGKGFITMRDVMKMVTVHDFTWTEEELQDMIRCFDNDKDGMLSLDEFRKIVTRCRLLKDC